MTPEIDTEHGLRGLAYSIIALLLMRVVTEVVKAAWLFINRHKIPTREELNDLTKALKSSTEGLAQQKVITEKMSQDMRRIFLFLKVIAGSKWPIYRKQVEEIEKGNSL